MDDQKQKWPLYTHIINAYLIHEQVFMVSFVGQQGMIIHKGCRNIPNPTTYFLKRLKGTQLIYMYTHARINLNKAQTHTLINDDPDIMVVLHGSLELFVIHSTLLRPWPNIFTGSR